jgi:voltage-gated potassium channel Kch
MQEVLQIQFFANNQPARFEVDKFLGQEFIFFLVGPATPAAGVLHAGIEPAEILGLMVLLWVQALFSNDSSQNYMPHQPIGIVAIVKQHDKTSDKLLETTDRSKDIDNRYVGPPNLSFIVQSADF